MVKSLRKVAFIGLLKQKLNLTFNGETTQQDLSILIMAVIQEPIAEKP